MSTTLSTGTISGTDVKFVNDIIWAAEALPNATTKTSDEFIIGKSQGGTIVKIYANTDISIADTKQLKFELLHAPTSGGSETSVVLYDKTAATTADTHTAGDLIVEYIPADTGLYCKLKITTTADESAAEKVDAYQTAVPR